MAEIDRIYYAQTIGNVLPVKAATTIEKGHLVGCEAATGYFRPLAGSDKYAGIASVTVDNSAGANGDALIVPTANCLVELDVTGSSITSWGATVYATSSSTFNVAGTNAVGVVVKHITGTTCLVHLKSVGE